MASTSTPLSVTLAGEQHDQAVPATTAYIRNLVVAQDGTVWAADSDINANLEAKVYRQDATGKTVATLTLPRPALGKPSTVAAPKPSTIVRGLYLDPANTLWISDYTYGTIYRYKVAAAADANAEIYYETPVSTATTGTHVQFGAIAYQALGGTKAYLWVLDTLGNLVAFDTEKPKGTPPARTIKIGKKADALQSSLVFHEEKKTLWMTAQDSASGKQQLVGIPAATLPAAAPANMRRIDLAGQTLALDGNTLYIGGTNGELWRMDLATENAQPALIATLKAGSDPVSISSIAVDKSGYLWIVDDRYPDDGHIYAVLPTPDTTPPAHVQINYALKQGTVKAAPAVVAWHIDSASSVESLYVSDQAGNGRVIRISPLPQIPPIDKDGKPAYTLKFDPDKGTADKGAAFGATEKPTAGIKLHAKTTKAPAADIAATVSLQVTSSDPGVLVALDGEAQRLTSADTAKPLAITDLKADATSALGHAKLTAIGRGRPVATAVYDGEVAPAITAITFSATGKRITPQLEVFSGEPVNVVTTPETKAPAKVTVTVTLDGPNKTPQVQGDRAHFDLEPHYSTNVVVGAGATSMGLIQAGKLAGDLTLTPSVPGHKGTPMTWTVIPVPTHMKLPTTGTNLSRRHPEVTLATSKFQLFGRERYGDLNSDEKPVPKWKLRLTITDTSIAKFKGPKMSNNGATFISETGEDGSVMLTRDDLVFERRTPGKDQLEISVRWKTTYAGPDNWQEPPAGQPSSTTFELQS